MRIGWLALASNVTNVNEQPIQKGDGQLEIDKVNRRYFSGAQPPR
jgi:hypothetical protein